MTAAAIIGTISGGGGLVWGLWMKIVKPFLKKRKAKQEIRERKEKAEESYRKKIDDIHNEMKLDGNGSMKTAIVNLKKVTERIEFRLDGIEEAQKVALNLQGVCYWIGNEAGEWVYASPNLCNLMGRSEQELLSNNWKSWIAAQDKERIVEAWEFSVENKTSFDEMYIIKKSDNSFLKIWSVAFPKIGKNAYGGGIMGKSVVVEGPF